MYEYQAWLKEPGSETAFCKIFKAENKQAVKSLILKTYPGSIIGVIAQIDDEITPETNDFFEALTSLSNAANNLSIAVNKVLQTWPAENNLPKDYKNVLKNLQEWLDAQKGTKRNDSLEITWNNLPLALSVKEVANILGLSTAQIYQFCKGSMYNFPVIQVGRKFVIPRDKFKEWLEKQATDHSSS